MACGRPGKIHKKSEVWAKHGKRKHRSEICRRLDAMRQRQRFIRMYASIAELMRTEA